jgi:hypothetical protein
LISLLSLNDNNVTVHATPPKKTCIQMNDSQKQKVRKAALDKMRLYKHAFKRATILYEQEKGKGKDGLLAKGVCMLIKEVFKVDLCPRTIQKKVKSGDIGVSLLRRGTKGMIDKIHFKNLCIAAESYIIINQNSGNLCECTYRKLCACIEKVVCGINVDSNPRLAQHLLQCVLKHSSNNLSVLKSKQVEDRRICWTNYKNISMWFDNWERDLVQLRTALLDPLTNKPYISKEQLSNNCNFDETCLSLDGSNSNHGGQPEMMLYDPRFPLVGKATSKSALTATMITGRATAREALPPHLQFQTKAKTKDTMRLQYDVAEHMPSIWGKFGKDKVCLWPVTFGQNEMGSMDDEEFEKYLMNSIVPLYPNAKDGPGKHVILKVDSDPGRANLSHTPSPSSIPNEGKDE